MTRLSAMSSVRLDNFVYTKDCIAVAMASPSLLRNIRHRENGFDREMFLFGMAFRLLETKSVTEMNLVWGVTWLTSAVVFGSILIMLLGATIIMQLRPMQWRFAVAGLMISLLAGYLIPVRLLVGTDATITLGSQFFSSGCRFSSRRFVLLFVSGPETPRTSRLAGISSEPSLADCWSSPRWLLDSEPSRCSPYLFIWQRS